MIRAAAVAGLAIAACGGRAPITGCGDDLRGLYTGERGERWMVLDAGDALEAYTVFSDGDVTGDVVAAPRVIDWLRAPGPAGGAELTGTLHRRYMRRADSCDAQVPARITRCAGDALDVVLADPAPPLGFAPCAWPPPAAPRVERWRRD